MKEFLDYDDAVADHFKRFNIKAIPVLSWEFNHQFLKKLQAVHADFTRLEALASDFKWQENDWDLKMRLKDQTILVTDKSLSIVFASHNLRLMNGYTEADVIGKTPKIFQGKETDLQTSSKIRMAVQDQQPFEETILNYKKDGSKYFCVIQGFPAFDKSGELCHFIAFETAA